MLNSIRPALSVSGAPPAAPPVLGPVGQSAKALGKALRTDDLDAARAAYVQLAKALPKDQPTGAGAPFVELGKALAHGDMGAAQAAFRGMLKGMFKGAMDRRDDVPAPLPVPRPSEVAGGSPKPSSTGGQAGSMLDAVA
jgi:hypothetical protein